MMGDQQLIGKGTLPLTTQYMGSTSRKLLTWLFLRIEQLSKKAMKVLSDNTF